MLRRLSIENLATIERVELELTPGLNALTGETGAGKSILIGGLELALGDRAQSGTVRPGAARAVVEATFEAPWPAALANLVNDELGLEWDGMEALALRREIAAAGRNRCFVNGQMVGVADLKAIGEAMVDLHGQHEHQSLLRAGAAREALDAFAGHDKLVTTYAAAWDETQRLRHRRAELEQAARDFDQRLDYLRFQVEEIERAAPAVGEIEALELEEKQLASAEALSQAAAEAYALLYEGGDDDQPTVLALLRDAARRITELAEAVPDHAEAAERVEAMRSELEDIAFAMRGAAESIQPDPERLNTVIERIEALRKLVRKHGGSEAALLEALATMKAEHEQMSLDEAERKTIEANLEKAEAALDQAGKALSQGRRRAADRFAGRVVATLAELNMDKATFAVPVEPLAEAASHGADAVDFLLAANPGLPPAPLRKVGSGGELSRVMLALKSALAERDAIPTLVFDEIDVGLSGETARRVGSLMRALADTHQIICITHHAPIAACAGGHVSVRKSSRDGQTFTRTVDLAGEDRLEELARMMGGDGDARAARELARQLLDA